MATEMKSWGTILRVFKRYFAAMALSVGFIEVAIYVGSHGCNPLIMFPTILAGSICALYSIVAGAIRMEEINDHGWPEPEICHYCTSLENRLHAVMKDRDELHKALAILKVD